MSARIPEDAFEVYVGMGPGRSYQALAEKYGVDKRSIVRHATKEMWADRLDKINYDVRAATDKKLVTDLQAVRERHIQQSRFVQGILLKGVKEASPRDAARMISALNLAWKHELLVLGEPTEHQANSVAEITLHEMRTLLVRKDEYEEDDHTPPEEEDDDAPPEEDDAGPIDRSWPPSFAG